MTYTILAVDPLRSYVGVASATGAIAVGSRVTWAKYPIGAVATQGYTNPSLGPLILSLIERGYDAQAALREALLKDPDPSARQVAVIDYGLNKAVHSGSSIPGERGECVGNYSVCVGNMLRSSSIPKVVCEFFEEGVKGVRSVVDLALLMFKSLMRGHELGGDRRGDRSIALLIVGDAGYGRYYDKLVDLRVDYSDDPFADLGELLREYFGLARADVKELML